MRVLYTVLVDCSDISLLSKVDHLLKDCVDSIDEIDGVCTWALEYHGPYDNDDVAIVQPPTFKSP